MKFYDFVSSGASLSAEKQISLRSLLFYLHFQGAQIVEKKTARRAGFLSKFHNQGRASKARPPQQKPRLPPPHFPTAKIITERTKHILGSKGLHIHNYGKRRTQRYRIHAL